MRRLLPEPAEDIAVDDAYDAPLGRRTDSPWVSLCMISSIDGSTVVDGNSKALSSPTDAAVLARLRQLADVILVGAGTVRAEGYRPPRKPGQRVGVVTNSGNIDVGTDLFTSGAGFLVTSRSSECTMPVDVLRAGDDRVDLREAVRRLGEVAGDCGLVQAEGGPALNGALLDADLLDEINLTTSPATMGGDGPRLATRAIAVARSFDVAQLALDDQGFVYTRWLRRRG